MDDNNFVNVTLQMVTQTQAVTLQGFAAKQMLMYFKDVDNNVAEVQYKTAGFMEHLANMVVFFDYTSQLKKEIIEMFQRLQYGECFYISTEWYTLSPAMIAYARDFLNLLQEGHDYGAAKNTARRRNVLTVQAELNENIKKTYSKQADDYEEKLSQLLALSNPASEPVFFGGVQ